MFGSNPNTMTLKTVYDDMYAITHYKQPVYKAFADERLVSKISKGNTVARSYASDFSVNTMGADGSYSTQAVTDTQETIVINYEKEVSFYLKELDLLQAHLPVKLKYATKAMNKLFLQIDGDVMLVGYQGAASTVDDGSILGGTAGNSIAATTANVQYIFAAAQTALQLQSVIYEPNTAFTGEVKLDMEKTIPVAAISPQLLQVLVLYLGGKNSDLGDNVSLNGHQGRFMNFNIFMSNNLAWTASLALSVQPTDGDTVTINGVTFTFKTTLGVTANNVLIGASAATAQANLFALVNAPATTTAQGVALTAADQVKVKNITGAQGTNAVTFTASGWGNVVVSSVLTSGSNVWTAGKQTQHNLFGVNKSITVVIQKRPELVINPVSGKVGKDYVTWTVYGLKVFKDQTYMLVDVQINSASFTAPQSVTF